MNKPPINVFIFHKLVLFTVQSFISPKLFENSARTKNVCVDTQGKSYSTVLLQAGGLLIVMNTQLERMVIMMNILKYLKQSQGKYDKQLCITVSITTK